MKKRIGVFKVLWALVVMMVCGGGLAAQQFSGVVRYTEQLVFQPDTARMNDPRYQQMMAMFQNQPSFKKILRINGGESLYLNDPEDVLPAAAADDPAQRMRNFMRQDNETYRHFESAEVLERTDFMGKKFLVSGDPSLNWKISMEQRMISGYPCMKATASDSLGSHEVWFTMAVPVPSGPRNYGNLPGLVIEARPPQGRLIITADFVEERPLNDTEKIAKPVEGKPVTRDEYRKIVRDKMKEMQQSGGGGMWMR